MRRVIGKLSTFGFRGMPAPSVQVFCYIARLNHGEWVDFLIDTGASGTCLHGTYAFDLQEHMRIHSIRYSYGIAGMRCGYYHEKVALLFRDDRGQPLHRIITIGIQQFTDEHVKELKTLEDCLACPSLLGRDILNKCLFIYKAKPEEITLTFR